MIEEFWREGDLERERGLAIGPMNDRETLLIPNSQVRAAAFAALRGWLTVPVALLYKVGFIDCIAHPLWEVWTEFVDPGQESIQLQHLKENRYVACHVFFRAFYDQRAISNRSIIVCRAMWSSKLDPPPAAPAAAAAAASPRPEMKRTSQESIV